MRFPSARRGVANAISEPGKRGLHHLQVPPEGHLTERRWDVQEPPAGADSVMQPDAQFRFRPSPIEFEMAYQVRVAIDRIRFAIKATDQFAQHPQQLLEAGLQLLDALDRLESAERGFQRRYRPKSGSGDPENILQGSNGSKTGTSRGAKR